MQSYTQPRALSALVLFNVAGAMRAAAHRMRTAAKRLDAWLEKRRALAPALQELHAMSYSELRDIGLTGFDVQHLAWGGEAPGRPWQIPDESETAMTCESCGDAPYETPRRDDLACLDIHVLKDIGAPHWMVAHAADESDREHLRWIALEHR